MLTQCSASIVIPFVSVRIKASMDNSKSAMKQVHLTTDGACIGNPGPGGWACILRYESHQRKLSGGQAQTTNNRMELQAVIEGLKALRYPCQVIVTTDSQYLRNGITKWIYQWKLNGWLRQVPGSSAKEPVKNRDLWEQLDALREHHVVQWEWTKGHANDADNNHCDMLAKQEARQLKGSTPQEQFNGHVSQHRLNPGSKHRPHRKKRRGSFGRGFPASSRS